MSKLAFENKTAQLEAMNAFNAGKEAMNEVINRWNALDVGAIDDKILNDLLRGGDIGSIVRKSLMESFDEKDLIFAGRKITRETMAGMIQPFDLTALTEVVQVAAVHFGAFEVGSIIGGKFVLDKQKVEEVKRTNTVSTDDLKTLEAVQSIIKALESLYASGKLVPEHTGHWLVKAGILDYYTADGLQPARKLFISNT